MGKVLYNVSPFQSTESAQDDRRAYSSRIFDFSTASNDDSDEYQLMVIKEFEYKNDDFVIGRFGLFEDTCREKELLVIRQMHGDEREFRAFEYTDIGPFYADGGFHLQPGKNWLISAAEVKDAGNGEGVPDGVFAETMDGNAKVLNVFFKQYVPPQEPTVVLNQKKPLDDLYVGARGILIDVKMGLDLWIDKLQNKDGFLADLRKIPDPKPNAKARYEIRDSKASGDVWKKLSYKELLQLIMERHGRDIHHDFKNNASDYKELISLRASAFRRPRKRKASMGRGKTEPVEKLKEEAKRDEEAEEREEEAEEGEEAEEEEEEDSDSLADDDRDYNES
jgi:hypothetical protein